MHATESSSMVQVKNAPGCTWLRGHFVKLCDYLVIYVVPLGIHMLKCPPVKMLSSKKYAGITGGTNLSLH